MPFVKIWIHAVWTTRNKETLLDKAIRQLVFVHIHQNALIKDIFVDIVNGYSEHVHCLFRLKNVGNGKRPVNSLIINELKPFVF